VYVFLIDGKVDVEGTTLLKRDALGLTDMTEFAFKALNDSFILFLEVPMN
jgi:hypothetical protein